MTPDTAAPPATTEWWQQMVPWWHAAFVTAVSVTAALALLTGAPRLVVMPLGLLVLAYVTLGAPALRRDAQLHGATYLGLAAVLLAWTVHLHPAGMVLLVCLYPQCFAMLDGFLWRSGLAALGITFAAYAANAQRQGWDRDALTASTATGAINVAAALAIGLFVDRLLRESNRRAGLVAALTAAQHELAEAEHLAGVHAERERLAHEIHDTLAQGFTSIVVLARAIDAGFDSAGLKEHSPLRDKLALLEETAQANLAEARALVAALPPADLHSGGLLAALRRAADRCARENGASTQVSVCGTPRALPAAYDVVLMRVAQEALANVAKHSHAQHVTLTMTYGEPGTSLAVCDDGVGFADVTPGGFGLAGMRQRVEQVGGQLCVEATPGGGTTVRVVLP